MVIFLCQLSNLANPLVVKSALNIFSLPSLEQSVNRDRKPEGTEIQMGNYDCLIFLFSFMAHFLKKALSTHCIHWEELPPILSRTLTIWLLSPLLGTVTKDLHGAPSIMVSIFISLDLTIATVGCSPLLLDTQSSSGCRAFLPLIFLLLHSLFLLCLLFYFFGFCCSFGFFFFFMSAPGLIPWTFSLPALTPVAGFSVQTPGFSL